MAKRKPKPTPKARIASIYASQKRRAAQHGQALDYTPQQLLRLYNETTHCRWCGDPIDGKSQCDHRKPVSRGGSWSLTNLEWICGRCNRRKGPLDDIEYQYLTECLIDIAERVGDSFVKCNVLKRLAAARF